MISRVSSIDPDQSHCPPISIQHALDAAQLGSWQYDPLRKVFSFDARCKEILGVLANRATLEEFMSWVHPDDAGRAWACLNDVLDPAEPRRYGIEFRIRRGDGEVRWVQNLGLAYFEGDGRDRRAVSLVGTLADITERKEYEEKLHLLMREVNHRARNMLSVVGAIAHQSVAGNLEDYVGRLRAHSGARSLSGPARPERMAWGRNRGFGPRPTLAFCRPHWFSYRHARCQPVPEPGFGASHWARAPRTRNQRREIWSTLDEYGSHRYRLGDRRRHLDHKLDRARWSARVSAEAARVRQYGYGNDG